MKTPFMGSKQKVFIVEDDLTTRRLLKIRVNSLGYETETFDNGKDAWEAFAKKQPQIVISDWKMPGLDGLELCKYLRKSYIESYTYFILVTAQRRSRVNLEQAIDAGVDDFLKKPISSEEIWNRIRVAERILGFCSQVKELEQLIPICTYCKDVRNDKDTWEQIEHYINNRIGANFTHTVCPDCLEKYVRPELEEFKQAMKRKAEAIEA